MPEEDGKITMSVYVQVIPKPIIPTPIPTPTDVPTDIPTDVPTDMPMDTPTSTPTPTPDGDFSYRQDDFTNPDDKRGKNTVQKRRNMQEMGRQRQIRLPLIRILLM